MPVNVPTVNTDDISFGPGVVKLGPSGATPTADVGALAEDAVTIEISSTKRDIMQGNPKTIEHSFSTEQHVKVTFTGIEWDFTTLQYGLGAGNTGSSVSLQTWTLGGDPLVETVALQITHYMAKAADTLTINVWKARPDGPITFAFSAEEHKFPESFEAMRSATNWAGVALATDEQLLQVVRTL